MDVETAFSFILLTLSVVYCSSQEKRLVLHSDADISRELSDMKSLLASQNQSLHSLSALAVHLLSEVQNLKVRNDSELAALGQDLKQLNTRLDAKDVEITQLKSRAKSTYVRWGKTTCPGNGSTLVYSASSSKPDKRLVLHSDIDISHELNDIKALLASQNKSIQSLLSIVNSKELEIAQLKSSAKSSYIRWGKTTCPGNGSTMVYSGMMANSDRANTGGGSNYLCLAATPTWDYYDDANGHGGVRGIEYQFTPHSATELPKFFGSNILNEDAPCALCETNRATNAMIPGTNECNAGWTKEYSGYLVTEYKGYAHSSEFICLDRRPDVIQGSIVSDDHSLLYMAEVECGSSSLCPPYVEGRELTCVVCSN